MRKKYISRLKDIFAVTITFIALVVLVTFSVFLLTQGTNGGVDVMKALFLLGFLVVGYRVITE